MNFTLDECKLTSSYGDPTLYDGIELTAYNASVNTQIVMVDDLGPDPKDVTVTITAPGGPYSLDTFGDDANPVDCSAGCSFAGTYGGVPFAFVYTSSIGGGVVSSTPSNPEIDALSSSSGNSVSDGGSDALGVLASGTARTLTYTIANSGSGDLTVATATSSNLTNVTVNSIGAPGSTTVSSGGGTTTFSVQFTPSAAGTFSFDLSFVNDDSDENPFNFTVSGTATEVPGFSQAVSPSTVLADEAATLTFTIDNTANGSAASALDFSNTLVSGLLVAGTPNAATTCTGGTLTATAGSGSISYTGGSVSGGATCTVTVDVAAASDGTYVNTSDVLTSNFGTSTTSSATLTVASPEIDLQRPASTSIADGGSDAQGSVAVGVQQVLTYTVANTGAATLTLTGSASSSGASNVSVDSISAPGSSTVAASGSTTFTVSYTPTAAGAFSFDLSLVSDDADEASYDITVSGTATAVPGFSQAVSPSTVLADEAATLTYTIDNTANGSAASALDFSNTLTSGLLVASTPNAATTCTGGTLTATSGSGSISYTGGSVSGGATCTVTVDVAAASDGTYVNTSGALTSSFGTSTTSSATLTVASPEIDLQRPASTSIADGGSDAQGSVAVGVQQVLTYTVANTGAATLTLTGSASSSGASNVSVDSISAPGSSTVAASGSTTFTVSYTPTAAGAFSFDLSLASDDADEASYDITVSGTATAVPGFSQAVSPSTVLADEAATLTYTIDNTANGSAASALDFSNTLTSGLLVASTPNAATTCTGGTLTATSGSGSISYTGGSVSGGATCTVTVDVAAASDGTYVNTSGALTSSFGTSTTSSATLTVASPEIDLQRPASTSIADGGSDAQGSVAVGVQQVLTYTVANTGAATLTLTGSASSSGASNVSVDSISAPGSSTVAASGSTTFTVSYTPTAAGPSPLTSASPATTPMRRAMISPSAAPRQRFRGLARRFRPARSWRMRRRR
ncbi:beta strand repeat-containing protein [Arenibacterium sp. LLYu02]|uniref:beta strand repeat-containing protein n=1 Tax=Arenibacterium sp. LLYu02 TaxID=3404132 RepID=UPI003B223FD9